MATNPFLGQLQLFAFGFAPKGWAPCNGQLLSIQQNAPLFSLLGTNFGGNGSTTFGLPNLQGRTPVGLGGDARIDQLGQVGGNETYTLTANDVISHSHGLRGNSSPANTTELSNNLLATATVAVYAKANDSPAQLSSGSVSVVGGQPHENRSPYLVMEWCIALVGIFPSRS